MVDAQLRRRGIVDARVLAAMERVPRELFVPEQLRDRAYDDAALPIGEEQTISQPFMVARICEVLAVGENDRVLDVGTGSGYQAAVLAELGSEVHTIERLARLARRARESLAAAGAVVAYPAKYGNSGIMTFIINQDRTVYQSDLGPNTRETAGRMQRFDPGPGWMQVKHPR